MQAPYLTERRWDTVREDYRATGSAWEYFTGIRRYRLLTARAYPLDDVLRTIRSRTCLETE